MTDQLKKRLDIFRGVVRGEAASGKPPKVRGMTVREANAICTEMAMLGIDLSGRFSEVSSVQASYVLGVNDRKIREFCAQGRLGRTCGKRYIIPVDDLLRFAVIPRPVGGAGAKALAEQRAKEVAA